MNKNQILIILSILPLGLSGCYTTLKQSGNYYSDFDPSYSTRENESTVAPDTMINPPDDSDQDVIVYNSYYSDPPAYYYPPYRNYVYGYDGYLGWGWTIGYPYYDPFYDPYHYYYGWCGYPSYAPVYCPEPGGNGTNIGSQRTFGARRTYIQNTGPFGMTSTSGMIADAAIPARIYKTSSQNASHQQPIQQERVRRNYRRAFGITEPAKKESSAENKPETSKETKREARPQESGRSASSSDRGRSAARNDRPANSGRSSQRSGNQGRKYKN